MDATIQQHVATLTAPQWKFWISKAKRCTAAGALGATNNPQAIPALLSTLESTPSAEVALEAAKALAELPFKQDASVTAIVQRFKRKVWERTELCEVLMKLKEHLMPVVGVVVEAVFSVGSDEDRVRVIGLWPARLVDLVKPLGPEAATLCIGVLAQRLQEERYVKVQAAIASTMCPLAALGGKGADQAIDELRQLREEVRELTSDTAIEALRDEARKAGTPVKSMTDAVIRTSLQGGIGVYVSQIDELLGTLQARGGDAQEAS